MKQWLSKIADQFNGTALPSERAIRAKVAAMGTRSGREDYISLLEKYPEAIKICDKHGTTALEYAAAAGDTEILGKLVKLGVPQHFYHGALQAAAVSGSQEAVDLLLKAGGVITDSQISVMKNMAHVYCERGPEGEPSPTEELGMKYSRGARMLEAAQFSRAEKHAQDARDAAAHTKLKKASVALPETIRVPGRFRLRTRLGLATGLN